jgi:hypothetical protein
MEPEIAGYCRKFQKGASEESASRGAFSHDSGHFLPALQARGQRFKSSAAHQGLVFPPPHGRGFLGPLQEASDPFGKGFLGEEGLEAPGQVLEEGPKGLVPKGLGVEVLHLPKKGFPGQVPGHQEGLAL